MFGLEIRTLKRKKSLMVHLIFIFWNVKRFCRIWLHWTTISKYFLDKKWIQIKKQIQICSCDSCPSRAPVGASGEGWVRLCDKVWKQPSHSLKQQEVLAPQRKTFTLTYILPHKHKQHQHMFVYLQPGESPPLCVQIAETSQRLCADIDWSQTESTNISLQ